MDETWEVLIDGVWVPLVWAVSPDACDYCKAGLWVGYDHPECETMVPESAPAIRY